MRKRKFAPAFRNRRHIRVENLREVGLLDFGFALPVGQHPQYRIYKDGTRMILPMIKKIDYGLLIVRQLHR